MNTSTGSVFMKIVSWLLQVYLGDGTIAIKIRKVMKLLIDRWLADKNSVAGVVTRESH